ncbi:helix-turn-helix domain-containing protein [Streptomyces sp. M19]
MATWRDHVNPRAAGGRRLVTAAREVGWRRPEGGTARGGAGTWTPRGACPRPVAGPAARAAGRGAARRDPGRGEPAAGGVGGIERLTIRAVAKEVGVAAPSIYLHFADKAELVWAALEDKYALLSLRMAAADAGADRDDPRRGCARRPTRTAASRWNTPATTG